MNFSNFVKCLSALFFVIFDHHRHEVVNLKCFNIQHPRNQHYFCGKQRFHYLSAFCSSLSKIRSNMISIRFIVSE